MLRSSDSPLRSTFGGIRVAEAGSAAGRDPLTGTHRWRWTAWTGTAPRVLHAGILIGGFLTATVLATGQAADEPPERTVTEEVPERLVPRKVRTEAEEDRLTSAAHFAQARLYLQRQKDALALKHLQRAWRFNQDRVALLDQIVTLASKLRRNEQAARYAVLSAERRPRDTRLLMQLGGLLGQQNDTVRALKMYEAALKLQAEAKLTPQAIAVRIEMGRLYFLNEDFENAARMFAVVRDALDDPQVINAEQRKALLNQPNVLYSLMAAAFFRDERFTEAAAMYRQADAVEPDPPRLSYQLAKISHKTNRLAEARQQLDQYLDAKASSEGMEPYQLLQEISADENPNPDASPKKLLAELRNRHAAAPKNVPLGYFLAAKLLAADQVEEAQTLYVDLLQRQPTGDAYRALATIYRRQANVPRLFEMIAEVVSKTESVDLLEDEIARIVEDPPLVTRLLKHAQAKSESADPQQRVPTCLAAARLALAAKRLDEFDTFVALAAEAPPAERLDVLEQLGLAVFIAEDAQRAARLFRQALAAGPDAEAEGSLQFYLAGAAQYAGETEAALAAAARAAELRDSPRVASRRPWILYQAKRYAAAAQQYRELLATYDGKYEMTGVREVVREARLILSNLAVEQQELTEAEEWLAQVLDEYPEDIGAMNDLGYLWVDQGKHLQRATRMIQRAVEAEPENVAYRDSLGWAYYRLGRFSDAIRELKIATAGDDPDGVILDHLADAHAGHQQPQEAMAVWQRALSAFRKADQMDRLPAIEAKIKKYSQD